MKRLFAAALLAAALLAPSATQAQTAPAPAAAIPRIVMVKLNVTDFARSERFYREVFGLAAPRVFNDHEHGFSFPNASGVADPNAPTLVLVLTPTAQPNSTFALAVADIDAVMARTPGAGGVVTRPPPAAGGRGYRVGFVTDPDGTSIEVIQATP